jgi:hypothetical protein
MGIANCQLMTLPKIADDRGRLTVIENKKDIPFDVSRIYYLYNVPENCERGSHAHKKLRQLIIPIAGTFEVLIDDGDNKETYCLSDPFTGLYIVPMIWRRLTNFSPGAVCLVLASDFYSEEDYYRKYDEFLSAVKKEKA